MPASDKWSREGIREGVTEFLKDKKLIEIAPPRMHRDIRDLMQDLLQFITADETARHGDPVEFDRLIVRLRQELKRADKGQE